MKKPFLLSFVLLITAFANAQAVTNLTLGRYEARLKAAQKTWEKGDLIFLDDSHYKLSAGDDAGEYKFSAAAQRIFFTSGPLKSLFTKVLLVGGKTIIIIPAEENSSFGITAEVWASKQ